MSRTERLVLWAVQGLVVGMALCLGGNRPWAVAMGFPVAFALLATTVRERLRHGGPKAPGLAALAAFVLLALATTLPLPPSWIAVLSPETARMYAAQLPGWPGAGPWSVARALAIDPFGVSTHVARIGIALATFAVVTAYPWSETARPLVFSRLLLTLIAGGSVLASLALLEAVAGNGMVMWVTGETSLGGRASGPFVNPNHFAAWLEMVIPVGLAFLVSLLRRLGTRLVQAANGGRGLGVRARRAWVAALVTYQRRLWAPLIVGAAVLVMLVAHVATGSRGGAAALLAGLGVMAAGALAGRRRWVGAVLALALVVGSAAALGAWATAEEKAGVDTVDASLAARLAVGVRATALIGDHPLFGTGLGSWLEAFRPYQQPPVEGGIWDHAHDDYLELAAETGAAGVALALLFAIAVCRGIRRNAPPVDGSTGGRRRSRSDHVETSEWRAALEDAGLLRWGLAGGVAAILVHSLVDFGLQMPANLLLLMVVLGLLVLSAPPQPSGGRVAPLALFALLGLAMLPIVGNQLLVLVGAAPLSSADCVAIADRTLAEEGDAGQAKALALLDRALDRAPADRDAYEALADTLGPGAEGDAAIERALALSPWASELRDRLALRRWARGEEHGAAADIEESMYRFPYLISHAYLGDDADLAPHDAPDVIRTLLEGDTLTTRLARMDGTMVDAVERGLARALDDERSGDARASILSDLVSLREARGRWADAASLLRAEAERMPDGGPYLARAAKDYLKASDIDAAEAVLLSALVRMPGQGDLYRALAVDVYAVRGDLRAAEDVLEAGERNAVDMLPVYDGVTEVLERREALRVQHMAAPLPPVPVREDVP